LNLKPSPFIACTIASIAGLLLTHIMHEILKTFNVSVVLIKWSENSREKTPNKLYNYPGFRRQ
jgi:hypothetical protein